MAMMAASPNFILNLTDAHVVQDARMTREGVSEIADQFSEGLYSADQMHTPALVDSYRHLKAVAKTAAEVSDQMRAEILNRLHQGETNAKGIVTLLGAEPNAKIEARPRQTAKMDELAMLALLNRDGLIKEATDEAVEVKDPVRFHMDLNKVIRALQAAGQMALASDLAKTILAHVKVKEALNEKKIEALAKSGRLDADEAAACYAVTTTYAFYDVTT